MSLKFFYVACRSGTKQTTYNYFQTACAYSCLHEKLPSTNSAVKDLKAFELIPGPKPMPFIGNIWRYAIGEIITAGLSARRIKLASYLR